MANYHKKRARRNSTATCMCKIYKKVGNSKDKWKYRDLKHVRYAAFDMFMPSSHDEGFDFK